MVHQMLEDRRAARSTNQSQAISEQKEDNRDNENIQTHTLSKEEQNEYDQMMQIINAHPEAIYAQEDQFTPSPGQLMQYEREI